MGLRKAYNCWTVSYATIGDWFAVCAAFLLTDPPQDSTGLGAKSAVYSWLIGVCRSSRARCTWPRGSATSTMWCYCCSTARSPTARPLTSTRRYTSPPRRVTTRSRRPFWTRAPTSTSEPWSGSLSLSHTHARCLSVAGFCYIYNFIRHTGSHKNISPM